MEQVDVIIIGAGVIGLAIASELGKKRLNTVLVEKNPKFGMETSSRNSEVIHAGIYYQTNSLKAQLCVEGKRMLYALCAQTGISHKKIGKIIVNTDPHKSIESLAKKAAENGVDDLILLSKKEINKRYNNLVSGEDALYSPGTGIIDSHALMKYLESTALERGVIISYATEVISIKKSHNNYEITIANPNSSVETLSSSIVINSAGLLSDSIASRAGFNIEKLNYTLRYRKGEYFKLSKRSSVPDSILVYPMPSSLGLGTHTVIDMAGALRLGPYTYYADKVIDYAITDAHKQLAFQAIQNFLVKVKEEDLSPDMSGISPDGQTDFIIREETDNGFKGFINLIGMNSPGLTSSLAIASYVEKLIP